MEDVLFSILTNAIGHTVYGRDGRMVRKIKNGSKVTRGVTLTAPETLISQNAAQRVLKELQELGLVTDQQIQEAMAKLHEDKVPSL